MLSIRQDYKKILLVVKPFSHISFHQKEVFIFLFYTFCSVVFFKSSNTTRSSQKDHICTVQRHPWFQETDLGNHYKRDLHQDWA
eukprot:c29692_g1_i1 orf=1039-1290(-)